MDAATFEAQFANAARQVWVVAAGILMDRHGADDVLQEVAVVAWQKRSEFQPGTNFAAWLCTIARHISLRHRTKIRRGGGMQPIDQVAEPTIDAQASYADVDPADLATPDADLIERLGLSAPLAKALATLDPTARACLLLRTILDCDFKEISAMLQIPEGTAMSHVHRSRRRLLDQMSPPPQATAPQQARE